MKIEITYPPQPRRRFRRRRLIAAARWPFIAAAYVCPIINLLLGGRAWSAVALWSLWTVWTLAIDTDMVEYNLISQFIKGLADTCILIFLTDALLSPGWALTVVPIVCFGGMLAVGALFFSDMGRQAQNMLPMIALAAICLLLSAAGLVFYRGRATWELAVMGAAALALLVGSAAVMGAGFLRGLKKWFHTR